jgi:hypothetical protein
MQWMWKPMGSDDDTLLRVSRDATTGRWIVGMGGNDDRSRARAAKCRSTYVPFVWWICEENEVVQV